MSEAASPLPGLRSPFDELIGLEWESVSPHRLVATVETDERHHQPAGIVHGGVYATIVETLSSVGAYLRVRGEGMTAVGVHNATDFIRPHTRGRLLAVAEPLHVGRAQQLWQVVIARPGDGKTVARGQVRLAVVPKPEGDRTNDDTDHETGTTTTWRP